MLYRITLSLAAQNFQPLSVTSVFVGFAELRLVSVLVEKSPQPRNKSDAKLESITTGFVIGFYSGLVMFRSHLLL